MEDTYTLNKFQTTDNVRTGLLCLLSLPSLGEHEDAILGLLLDRVREAETTLGDGRAAAHRGFDYELIGGTGRRNLDGLCEATKDEGCACTTKTWRRTLRTSMAAFSGIFSLA